MANALAVSKPEQSPMQMIQKALDAAIEGGKGLEVVGIILEEQRKMMDRQDREAFNAALRRIQNNLKTVPKRGWNPQTKSRYAKAEDVDNAIEGLLKEESMALSFRPEPSGKESEVLIIGVLSLGAYSREYPLPMPADGKGPQGGGVMSRTHATGSAITYAKRYLKNMIFNLRFEEKDDDGNAASTPEAPKELIPDHVVEEYMDALREAPDLNSLKSLFAECYQKAKKLNDNSAKKAFQDTYETAKRRLQ